MVGERERGAGYSREACRGERESAGRSSDGG